jgi:GNAT superfamily N-acetyltransferase
MTLKIRQGDFEAFFQVPFEIYRNTPYVSPLKSDLRRFLSTDKNPLFSASDDIAIFTAHQGGRAVGRITAHVHRASNERHQENTALFGYFDCADDAEAAQALLRSAESWARTRGFTQLRGNFNLTAMQMVGVVTDGFENTVASDCMWSPPHLAGHLEANGYERYFPMTTHQLDLIEWRARAGNPVPVPPGLVPAPVARRTLSDRIHDARAILNTSFDSNPMFVPVSREEYDFQAKDLKWIVDTRLSVILHDETGAPAAALLCIPDLAPLLQATRSRLGLATPWHFLRHRLTNRRAVIIYYGTHPNWHGKGAAPYMVDATARAALAAGYTQISGTWIADVNGASLRQMERVGGKTAQRLHLFRKSL